MNINSIGLAMKSLNEYSPFSRNIAIIISLIVIMFLSFIYLIGIGRSGEVIKDNTATSSLYDGSFPGLVSINKNVIPDISQTTIPDPSGSSASASTTTNVTVNGQQIPVPENGSVSKSVDGGNGSHVNISIDNSQSSSTTSHGTSTQSLHINTQSSTEEVNN